MVGNMRSTIVAQQKRASARVAQVDAAGGLTMLLGEFPVTGIGEVLVPIAFPVRFADRPLFFPGGALGDNQETVETQLPTITGMVKRWTTLQKSPSSYWYVGAEVAVVVTGQEGQETIFNWMVIGTALTNPINPTEGTGDTA